MEGSQVREEDGRGGRKSEEETHASRGGKYTFSKVSSLLNRLMPNHYKDDFSLENYLCFPFKSFW